MTAITTRPGPQRSSRGFTLVEVLVALAIMALLAMLAWQGVDGMVRAKEVSQGSSERSLRLASVLAQWERDLQAVQDSGAAPALAFDGSSLRLTRRSDEGIALVVWSLREGVWRRWAGPSLRRADQVQQAWLASQQLLGNEDGQIRLFDQVSNWQVFFYRGNAWSNAQSSADFTPAPAQSASAPAPAARAQLPTGVRLVIDFGSGALTRDVVLGPQSQ